VTATTAAPRAQRALLNQFNASLRVTYQSARAMNISAGKSCKKRAVIFLPLLSRSAVAFAESERERDEKIEEKLSARSEGKTMIAR
jgi:hypothetical protein